jgi:hypothetical protein
MKSVERFLRVTRKMQETDQGLLEITDGNSPLSSQMNPQHPILFAPTSRRATLRQEQMPAAQVSDGVPRRRQTNVDVVGVPCHPHTATRRHVASENAQRTHARQHFTFWQRSKRFLVFVTKSNNKKATSIVAANLSFASILWLPPLTFYYLSLLYNNGTCTATTTTPQNGRSEYNSIAIWKCACLLQY